MSTPSSEHELCKIFPVQYNVTANKQHFIDDIEQHHSSHAKDKTGWDCTRQVLDNNFMQKSIFENLKMWPNPADRSLNLCKAISGST